MIPQEEARLTEIRQALLVLGDNLAFLKNWKATGAPKMRLVYLDPPFDTGATWSTKDGSKAYVDRWQGDAFMQMMEERLLLVRDVAGLGASRSECRGYIAL